jgi:hypothetical protein
MPFADVRRCRIFILFDEAIFYAMLFARRCAAAAGFRYASRR